MSQGVEASESRQSGLSQLSSTYHYLASLASGLALYWRDCHRQNSGVYSERLVPPPVQRGKILVQACKSWTLFEQHVDRRTIQGSHSRNKLCLRQ